MKNFIKVNPVRNSSRALNPALRGGTPYGAEPGIILKSNPVAEQRGIISNGVKLTIFLFHLLLIGDIFRFEY
jgi:hypothetical protein